MIAFVKDGLILLLKLQIRIREMLESFKRKTRRLRKKRDGDNMVELKEEHEIQESIK